MDKPLFDKAYDPKAWEEKLGALWQESGFFNPDVCIEKGVTEKKAPSFSIVLPPPNVTGTLHVGHASMLAIEDTVVRFKRMSGYRTLWLPGTDHAAIATQSKVEKLLQETEGKTRHDLGRTEFLKRVEQFAQESHDTIVHQVKKLGSSVDWSREAYTLDEKRSLAVRTAFKKMYDAGIIYRGNRIVNWDPVGQTTISDDEVVYKEEKAKLYYLKYGPFDIATARPETKFGDKYVVMHPEDERYKEYRHGDTLTVDWINGPIEATIIKDEVIDQEFGTGVMTITPAHSQVDFDLAEKHHLDIEPVIDQHGKLLPIAGELAGEKIEEAREKIVATLKAKGLLIKIDEDYVHQVATAERTGATIEPQVMRQWFVAVNKEFERDGKTVTLKSLMHDAVAEKKISILPEHFEKTYFHWIDNLRDWCISRQLWYGHQIPVWYCLRCKEAHVNKKISSRWFIVRHGETEANAGGTLQGHSDSPLTEMGREQVGATAKKLQEEGIGLIISSDLGRCRETAGIISEATGAEIVFDEALRERDLGEAEGLHKDMIKEKYGDIRRGYNEKPIPGMESFEEVEERVFKAFQSHHDTHGKKNVVIVSHGGSIRMLVKAIRALTPEEALGRPSIQNASSLSLDVSDEACACGSTLFEQDPDTLDTWFSSGLWTFSTLGWPEKIEDLKRYHPTTLLETGYDILFFWVARMILMSEYLLEEVPFKTVYLHGLVRDEKGRKMSKSLGNIVDPLDVIEKYGADALRLSLIMGATPGNDLKLGDEKITAMRNFVNKLWNISRYVSTAVPKEELEWEKEDIKLLSPADHWILARFAAVRAKITTHLNSYNLSLAAEELRTFTWNDFADWYVEAHKVEKNDTLLVFVLNKLLRLWHPFMPFVTEAIFTQLYPKESLPLMVQKWETKEMGVPEKEAVDFFESLTTLTQKIRNVRALYHIDPKESLTVTLVSDEKKFSKNFSLLEHLGRIETIQQIKGGAQPTETAQVTAGALMGFVHLSGVIDIKKEKARLTKESKNLQKFIVGLETRLADKKFTDRAPKEIIEQQKISLEEAQAKEGALQESIHNLN